MGKVPLFSRQKPSKDQFVFRILFVSFSSFFFLDLFLLSPTFVPKNSRNLSVFYPNIFRICSLRRVSAVFLSYFFPQGCRPGHRRSGFDSQVGPYHRAPWAIAVPKPRVGLFKNPSVVLEPQWWPCNNMSLIRFVRLFKLQRTSILEYTFFCMWPRDYLTLVRFVRLFKRHRIYILKSSFFLPERWQCNF